QRRTCEEHKAELEEENYHLRSEIQIEVDTNRRNEKQIRDLECDYDRCVQEIQILNREIERLENASKEEIIELNIPDFLAQLRLDLQNQGIDPNDNVQVFQQEEIMR
ncbi:2505_t:CDS:2, partial [Funneliformis geosporum]